MEIAILILSIISIFTAIICIYLVSETKKKLDMMNMTNRSGEELRELQNTLYNELSRNRTEQSNIGKNQRDEISQRFAEMYDRLEKLTDANTKSLQNLTGSINNQFKDIRESAALQSEKQNTRMEISLDKIRQSNEKKLDEMRQVVDEKLTNTLTQRLDSSFKTVSDQLEHLYRALGEMKEMSGGITDNVSTLNRVLTNVKARGTWAEIQLKNILDQTIPGMYVENFASDEKTRERVEFAIKIPTNDGFGDLTYLPIDSKFPVEDYIRLCDAAERGDPEALAKARKDLEDRVLREAKDITKYIKTPKTTPFAIMYLASE